MNALEFLASVVGSIAWPGTVLALVFLLREPLKGLLPLLQRLRYKELEIEFGQGVREVNAEVAAELPASSQPALPPASEQPVLEKLAELSPRSAVLEAWRDVESAALDAARSLGAESFRSSTLSYQALRTLEQSEKLDRGIVSLLRDLRGLRNQAAHAPDFALSPASALEYAAAAQRVAAYLRGIPSVA